MVGMVVDINLAIVQLHRDHLNLFNHLRLFIYMEMKQVVTQVMKINQVGTSSGCSDYSLVYQSDYSLQNHYEIGDRGSKVESDLLEKTAPPSNFCVVESP